MENKRWKIWMLFFDQEGKLVGHGVHPRDYAHKKSADRRAKQLWGVPGENKMVMWKTAQKNPFIESAIPVLYASRAEAETILAGLEDLIETYGSATVSDMYELSGLPDYGSDKHGWVSTKSFYIERSKHGYILRAPNAHYIV